MSNLPDVRLVSNTEHGTSKYVIADFLCQFRVAIIYDDLLKTLPKFKTLVKFYAKAGIADVRYCLIFSPLILSPEKRKACHNSIFYLFIIFLKYILSL